MQNSSKLADATPPSVPELSSAMKRLRLKILKSVKPHKLDEAFGSLRSQLSTEKNETSRLGSLAAQTWLIRQRLQHLALEQLPTVEECLDALEPKPNKLALLKKVKPEEAPTAEVSAKAESLNWEKVKILEETVVNGMRFFKDFVIEVNAEDAKKLVDAKKAEIVSQDAPASAETSETEDTPKKAAKKKKPEKSADKPEKEASKG